MKAEKQTESTIILHTESSTNIGEKIMDSETKVLKLGCGYY